MRYQALADFLAAKKGSQWDASFDEIEKQLGFRLPNSAYKYQAWWANQSGAGHSQTKGWRSVGWRTSRLDLERQRVRFERERQESAAAAAAPDDDLMRRAYELTGISDENLLVREALSALIAREAGRRLFELGGTMPNLKIPPRRRPPY